MPDRSSPLPDRGSSSPDRGSSSPDRGSLSPARVSRSPNGVSQSPDRGSLSPDRGSQLLHSPKKSVKTKNDTAVAVLKSDRKSSDVNDAVPSSPLGREAIPEENQKSGIESGDAAHDADAAAPRDVFLSKEEMPYTGNAAIQADMNIDANPHDQHDLQSSVENTGYLPNITPKHGYPPQMRMNNESDMSLADLPPPPDYEASEVTESALRLLEDMKRAILSGNMPPDFHRLGTRSTGPSHLGQDDAQRHVPSAIAADRNPSPSLLPRHDQELYPHVSHPLVPDSPHNSHPFESPLAPHSNLSPCTDNLSALSQSEILMPPPDFRDTSDTHDSFLHADMLSSLHSSDSVPVTGITSHALSPMLSSDDLPPDSMFVTSSPPTESLDRRKSSEHRDSSSGDRHSLPHVGMLPPLDVSRIESAFIDGMATQASPSTTSSADSNVDFVTHTPSADRGIRSASNASDSALRGDLRAGMSSGVDVDSRLEAIAAVSPTRKKHERSLSGRSLSGDDSGVLGVLEAPMPHAESGDFPPREHLPFIRSPNEGDFVSESESFPPSWKLPLSKSQTHSVDGPAERIGHLPTAVKGADQELVCAEDMRSVDFASDLTNDSKSFVSSLQANREQDRSVSQSSPSDDLRIGHRPSFTDSAGLLVGMPHSNYKRPLSSKPSSSQRTSLSYDTSRSRKNSHSRRSADAVREYPEIGRLPSFKGLDHDLASAESNIGQFTGEEGVHRRNHSDSLQLVRFTFLFALSYA